MSSVWYRLAMRIFIARFTGDLHRVYSLDQHGFCPSRNVITALHNVACTVEYGLGHDVPVYLLSLDVEKAYDSVDRRILDQVMGHLGIADNRFYKLATLARDDAVTQVVVDGET